ncbi:hypothetical protein GCM10018793_49900 [Streptomyces sulfonofaciens]|uniref:HTH luxR-type domain-containing protein n=1 Tax=Streptomyces sulfonofaciens TaxID=68272 RepID=A0A919GIP3_9ACTN|nr:helix-turn-helix domain-containing protein [Streptomyces sulfonofaciens]GHH84706.1 hypothetical protein GCM10018793_49900 [Streptomyces sulfonofaciens]
MLTALGISPSDERIYRLFLDGADLTARQVAEASGLTEGRVRGCVARLTGLGLLRRTGPGRYQAVNPETALLPLLSRRRLEAEAAFGAARTEVDAIADTYRAGQLRTDPGNLVEVLSGREVVTARVEELTNSASSHIWALDRPPYLARADGAQHSNDDERAATRAWLARGIEVRSIYCPQSMERPGRFETLMELGAEGEQSRMLPTLPFKLHIIDKRVALVSLVGGVYDSLAVVHPSGLLDALIELYEAYWERAEPIGAPSPEVSRAAGFSHDEVVLLGMLKAGLKDQAIAHQLGTSTRTATRRIASVLARLGARNRFQAGFEAAVRGLV